MEVGSNHELWSITYIVKVHKLNLIYNLIRNQNNRNEYDLDLIIELRLNKTFMVTDDYRHVFYYH